MKSDQSFTFEENEIPTSQLLPHLTGDAPTGFAIAKRLAIAAGLIEEPQPPDTSELEDWFRRSCAPLIEQARLRHLEEDAKQEALDIENYYESRSARYKFNLMLGHQRRADNDHGMGLYEWSFGGKAYRSWLGNQPLLAPRQIAGMLLARYPGNEVVVAFEGWSTTNCGGAAFVAGIPVPRYRAFISPRAPNFLHTYERLFLDHGRSLDREEARNAEAELRAENLSREGYAERIAQLCRDAPADEDWNDYQPGRWLELDPKDGAVVAFETDDTRDHPAWKNTEGMLDYGQHGFYASTFNKKEWEPNNYEWEDGEFQSDMDTGKDVQDLIGFTTQQIDETADLVGYDVPVKELRDNMVQRRASEAKVEALLNRAPEQLMEF